MLRGEGNSQTRARFQILGPLGAGGFGAVYEAVDAHSGQHVALKELDDTSPDSIARFKQEFRALTECHHENLVSVKELIEQEGRWLIVMELVPGVDFLRYVRRADNDNANEERCDEPCLRVALIGMLRGLAALHGYGIVHRDLKPGNVRVRPDGRAVLLDFGLATSVDPKQQSAHSFGVGTALYMAPEQARGHSVGTAADLYALGVCLFEALTGQPPFAGDHGIQMLLEKQTMPAPLASSLRADVPPDLDALCARLLATDAAARPTAAEALNLLSGSVPPLALNPPRVTSADEFFAGREAELGHLERALARTHEGELRVVLVEGESGVGKSELVSEFLRRTQARHEGLWVLRGRCYENEQVSYKAFDGCIDELSKLLRRMSVSEARGLLPARAALLGQLFPVLRDVKGIASAAREGTSADPSARRLEAFAALAQLLAKAAEDRPLVLVLDDLQWADAESFRLLSALSEQNPRPPVLLVGTVRPRDELDGEVRAQLELLRKRRHVDVIPLSGLPREQAKLLTRKLFGKDVPVPWLEMIADESQGHPLFISELVQYTHSHDFASRGKLSLEAALRARIDRLGRHARELLEIIGLAARPHPSNVFAAALGVTIEEPTRALLAAKLLRQRRGDELGCYHDRIRHGVVELIASSRLPALHHQLASALEKVPNVDASESAHHWDLAGHAERASAAYELAADRAFDALAVGQAANFYARAIALAGKGFDERQQRLTVRRAEALTAAGSFGEASQLYRRASDSADGSARIRLRSRAASYLILSGDTGAGLEAARELLREIGFAMPASLPLALVRYGWDLFCIAVRGVRRRAGPNVESAESVALSVMRDMRRAIMIVHPTAAVLLGVQYVRRAMQGGSLIDFGYGITWRAWSLAAGGAFAKALPLLEEARRLLFESDPTQNDIAAQTQLAGSAHLVALDWPGAAVRLHESHEIARQHCAHDAMLLTAIRYHLGITWYMLGEYARIAREVPGWLAEARERKDVLAVALLTGTGNGFIRHLLADAPEAAVKELESSFVPKPEDPYAFTHLGQFLGIGISLNYGGGHGALRYLDQYRAEHGRAFLLRTGAGRRGMRILEAYCLVTAHASAAASDKPELLLRARRAANALARYRSPYPQAMGRLVLAQVEGLSGDREQAVQHAQQALRLARNLPVQARSAKYLLGILEGGASGRQKYEDFLVELRGEGFQNPVRALNMFLPAAPTLVASEAQPLLSRTTLLLNRYEVTGQLDSGGFGALVSARDVRTGHMVAIKELVRTGGTSIERFKREFRALSDVHHENILQLESLFEHEGRWYIAMELVEGADLVAHVRASGRCDGARLGSAFFGLARGLEILHELGLVHCDVKPENVVVTSEGRPLLIDFSWITRVGQKSDVRSAGTLGYAAPEQLHGAASSPASDVYSLGACLFEALSGQRPFAEDSGSSERKRSARTLPELPGFERERALCLRMLAERPEERPSLNEVIACFAPAAHEGLPSQRVSVLRATLDDARPEWIFAGRERELTRLAAMYRQQQRMGLTLVLVEGESGLGKSALVTQFASLCEKENPQLHVLRGRCYENEQVAFKAFDRAIDQLADLLRALPEPRCEAILPKRAALLGQLFPVLAGVPAIERVGKKGLPADPATRKQAGRECFARLLAGLCAERRLLLVIDDLQWADSESFDLLRALIAHGPLLAPLFVVCTVRPKSEIEPSVLRELDALNRLPGVEKISLGMLDEQAGMQLARQLWGRERDVEGLSALVLESKGHPLFLRELIEHDRRGLTARGEKLTLDDALGARIASLSPAARTLLELVAVLGKPYGVQVFERAFPGGDLSRDALVSLLGQGLVQRRGDKLVCYHDRIRHVTLARLSTEWRAQLAASLAAALSRELRADLSDRARLWDEAGEPAEAVSAYELAGNQALEILAFAQAEQDYGRALTLLGDSARDEGWKRLAVARGHALVGAGRSAEAARMFQAAAELADGEEKVRLRIWTAQHLIQSAQVEAGVSAATGLLSELGLSMPTSDAAAKARIVYERGRVKLRGIRLGQRKTSAAERLVLDALHGLSAPMRDCAFLPGSALMAQYLRRALSAGDPVHSARALAYEALWRSVNAVEREQGELFEQSRALAEATSKPDLIAEVDLVRGLASVSQRQMTIAPTYLWRAHDLLQSQCPGHQGLLTASRTYLGMAWFHAGNFEEMRRHMGEWLAEARARDDRYAIAALCGFGSASFRHVVEDLTEHGLEELIEAMASWPKGHFTTNHAGAFVTQGMMTLCVDEDGARTARMLAEQESELDGAFLMRTPSLRLVLQWFRAVAQLRSIARVGAPGSKETLARARAEARVLRRTSGALSKSVYLFLESWARFLEGNRDGALETLRLAEQAGANTGPLNTIGIRYMLGTLEGGEQGRQRCNEVRSQLEALGLRDWRLVLTMRTAGRLALLEG